MAGVIPDRSLLQHIAILGKAGSGKTYTAKGIAEALLTERKRVCIIDPTGVWWGLRSNASGTKAAFPIVVFGGEHADVPLSEGHGHAIAEIIASTDTSAVIDTRHMGVGERTRFFADFAETLLRKNKGPLHLIIDEAHLFAPQGRVNDPQSGKMLHAANNLVSLGRAAGLRIIMITQRPAKLHKDSLTQAETLVALRLIAPQDRGAVEDWIGEWADPKLGKELLSSLPSLPTGEGWIWAPEMGVLKRTTFPKIKTYDSSRAPDGEQDQIVLANIDLPSIHARLEAVAKEAVENDPKRLRARLAQLEKQIRTKSTVDPHALREAERKGFDRGKIDGHAEAMSDLAPFAQSLRYIAGIANKIAESMEISSKRKTASERAPPPQRLTRKQPGQPVAAQISRPSPAFPKPAAEDLSGPQQKILDAAALLETLGLSSAKKNHVAAFAGVSSKSSGFEKNLSTLRTKGLLDYPKPGELCLTAPGKTLAHYPDTPATAEDLHQAWLGQLSEPQGKILRALIERYPSPADKERLASEVGVSALSSGYEKNLSTMRSLGIIDYPSPGMVVAANTLFPEAA